MRPVDAEATVVGVEPHPLPYYTLKLRVPATFAEAQPGQFVMVRVGDLLEPYLRRAFSVHDVSRDGDAAVVDILAKVVGRGTQILAASVPGERLQVLGPLGRAFQPQPARRVALVAGGVGSAPLYLLAKELNHRRIPFDFYYGGYSAVDLVRRQAFLALTEEQGGSLTATTEDGSFGETGLITEPLERALAAGFHDSLYACGPMGLMARVSELARQGSFSGQVSLETPMGCGFGACLGCAVPHVSGRFVLCCKDGPVFALDEIAW